MQQLTNTPAVSARAVPVCLERFNELHGLSEEQEGFLCCQDHLIIIVAIPFIKVFNNSYNTPCKLTLINMWLESAYPGNWYLIAYNSYNLQS